jgi:AmmeMemoRadiSam system protein A
MPEQRLPDADRAFLLSLARKTIENHLSNKPLTRIDKDLLSPCLQGDGASFVTLTYNGYLRGCVGALEAYQNLAEDVQEHAIAAAFEDYRFPPVQRSELDGIRIEISYLTRPNPINYTDPYNLVDRLRPNIDGVIIRDGSRRATFLPQVWEKIPDPEEFLDQLCMKMGASHDLWRQKKLEVLTYQVEEFHE